MGDCDEKPDKKQWGLGQREQMPEILKRQGLVIGWWGSSKDERVKGDFRPLLAGGRPGKLRAVHQTDVGAGDGVLHRWAGWTPSFTSRGELS